MFCLNWNYIKEKVCRGEGKSYFRYFIVKRMLKPREVGKIDTKELIFYEKIIEIPVIFFKTQK